LLLRGAPLCSGLHRFVLVAQRPAVAPLGKSHSMDSSTSSRAEVFRTKEDDEKTSGGVRGHGYSMMDPPGRSVDADSNSHHINDVDHDDDISSRSLLPPATAAIDNNEEADEQYLLRRRRRRGPENSFLAPSLSSSSSVLSLSHPHDHGTRETTTEAEVQDHQNKNASACAEKNMLVLEDNNNEQQKQLVLPPDDNGDGGEDASPTPQLGESKGEEKNEEEEEATGPDAEDDGTTEHLTTTTTTVATPPEPNPLNPQDSSSTTSGTGGGGSGADHPVDTTTTADEIDLRTTTARRTYSKTATPQYVSSTISSGRQEPPVPIEPGAYLVTKVQQKGKELVNITVPMGTRPNELFEVRLGIRRVRIVCPYSAPPGSRLSVQIDREDTYHQIMLKPAILTASPVAAQFFGRPQQTSSSNSNNRGGNGLIGGAYPMIPDLKQVYRDAKEDAPNVRTK
jgi:hypothetical protein